MKFYIKSILCIFAIFVLEIRTQTTDPPPSEPTTVSAPKPTTPKLTLAQNVNKAAMECQAKLNSKPEFMALLSTKNIPTNERMRCFLLCVYETLGLVEDNKFSAKNAELLSEQRFTGEELQKAKQLVDVCDKWIQIPANNTEFCVLGRLIRTCFRTEGEKINFFPRA